MNKKNLIFILIILFVPANSFSSDWFQPFNESEIITQALFTGICLMDWSQTIEISRNPQKYHETNMALGKHPSEKRVNTLIPAGIISHALITWAIPKEWRPYWQYIWIGIEIDAVHTNLRSGIAIKFR